MKTKFKAIIVAFYFFGFLCNSHAVKVLPSFLANGDVAFAGKKTIVSEEPFVNPYLSLSKSVIIPENSNGILMVDNPKLFTPLHKLHSQTQKTSDFDSENCGD